ncbi:MAG: hypothetical protein ACFHX7_23395 [Pseudomonadota bacterium]
MRQQMLGPALVVLALAGCAESPPPQPPFSPVGDMKQTMNLVLDPAADVIWGSAGFILTAEGEQDLAPTTDEQWLAVKHSAAVVAESGNLLMLPGRAVDAAAWMEISGGLVEAGKRAMAAADAKDADALFEAGGDIYRVCAGCHEIYMVDNEAAPKGEPPAAD